jgi:hypothetical protein
MEKPPLMRFDPFALFFCFVLAVASVANADSRVIFSGEKRLNNLVAELLEVADITQPGGSFAFQRPRDGWIFVTAVCRGAGTISLKLDDAGEPLAVFRNPIAAPRPFEAVRNIPAGKHQLQVQVEGRIKFASQASSTATTASKAKQRR